MELILYFKCAEGSFFQICCTAVCERKSVNVDCPVCVRAAFHSRLRFVAEGFPGIRTVRMAVLVPGFFGLLQYAETYPPLQRAES